MRELISEEINLVSGAYGENIYANIAEGVVCSIGGAVIGCWTLATAGGRGASQSDIIGIGGGFTALIGMVGGAAIGAVLGAISGPFVGYKPGLVIVEGMLNNLMMGKPGL